MADSVLCLMREPFADKVPSLRSLLDYLSQEGYTIHLLSPTDVHYLPPTFLNENLRYKETRPFVEFLGVRRRIPITSRLVIDAWIESRHTATSWVLGAGSLGIIAATCLAKVRRLPLINFCIEFPQIRRPGGPKLTWYQSFEHTCLRSSDLVITQDWDHALFLTQEIGVSKETIVILPNSSRGRAQKIESRWLFEQFELSSDTVVILHSGGLGRWFECLELAEAATSWPSSWRLIFHTSHKVEADAYFQVVKSRADSSRVLFSTEPVPAHELDRLVSSAHIGVALYSVRELGYRAELMGLAAGKIGQYLKCGLPVVATDVPTIRNYIDAYQCGICVQHASEVKEAIENILENYDRYSANAIRCFNELWEPDRYCAVIADRLRRLRS